MCQLYLKEQGSKLCRSGKRLLVKKEGEVLLSAPLHRVDRVIVMGQIQITASVMNLLLDKAVPLVITSQKGRIRGTLRPPLSPCVKLRQHQYEIAKDIDYCSRFVYDLVLARANNARMVTRRYMYNHPSGILKVHIKRLDELSNISDKNLCIDSLRGHEGIVMKEYFSALVSIFEYLGLNFSGRIKRPPEDPVNSVLSFIYVVLTGLVTSTSQAFGLDVFCGLLHKPNRNAPALALDLVEQFRQPIADRFVMLVFNKRILQKDDFCRTSRFPVAIKDKAKRRLIENWEKFINKPQRLLGQTGAVSPLDLIHSKIEEFTKAVHRKEAYQNYRLCE